MLHSSCIRLNEKAGFVKKYAGLKKRVASLRREKRDNSADSVRERRESALNPHQVIRSYPYDKPMIKKALLLVLLKLMDIQAAIKRYFTTPENSS